MRGQIFPKFLDHHRFVIGPVADVHGGLGVAFEDFNAHVNYERSIVYFPIPC